MLGLVSRVARHAAPRAAPAFAAVTPPAAVTGVLPTMLRGFAAAASTGKITQIIGGASPSRALRFVVQPRGSFGGDWRRTGRRRLCQPKGEKTQHGVRV